MKFKFIYVFLLFACREEIDLNQCQLSDIGLSEKTSLPIGVAIDFNKLKQNNYLDVVEKEFSSITPENIFKATYLSVNKDDFNFRDADSLIQFSQENNKRLHAHTLIWHEEVPYWMLQYKASNSEWNQIYYDYITQICNHFRGKVSGWDVVNEAFEEDGTLRKSFWKEKVGSDYIEKAFIYAHKADPSALLFYNDYNLSYNERKRNAVIKFLKNLIVSGIPIHGVGLQSHISISHPENTQIIESFDEFAKLNLAIHLSEIDISVNPLGKEINLNEDLIFRQGEKLSALTNIYTKLPHQLQYGMTFWGVSDSDSWIMERFNREDYPLLFDDNYKKKISYCYLWEML